MKEIKPKCIIHDCNVEIYRDRVSCRECQRQVGLNNLICPACGSLLYFYINSMKKSVCSNPNCELWSIKHLGWALVLVYNEVESIVVPTYEHYDKTGEFKSTVRSPSYEYVSSEINNTLVWKLYERFRNNVPSFNSVRFSDKNNK